ncbi:hypothetical protein NC653_038176 [Populus alba x Populus x berolinensis]|uniref:Uncharacterized protein n=1 Tax=Populus alba x Populus x berolinensis TaxID=444605 RepID=A0AAD6LG06_9ROSI|nr:hypothetical protein NC653_038176 [Populus alba x Populus x berolinensis]
MVLSIGLLGLKSLTYQLFIGIYKSLILCIF